MLDIIQHQLDEIAQQQHVRILFACESGSRAWGFPSTDSDYDVRFIYVHPKNYYLSIDDRKDVIELPVNEVLDINGWDLRKALQLLRKSNAPLYEWLQSPVVYRKDEAFFQAASSLMPQYFSNRAGMHHYLSMARNCFEQDLQANQVRIKKYFYALRPLLAALWIADKQTVPPMDFASLRLMVKDQAIIAAFDDLLEQKKTANEKSLITPVPVLQQFIADSLAYCYDKMATIAENKSDTEALNTLFRNTLL